MRHPWLQACRALPESKLSNVCQHFTVLASSELAAVFWPKALLSVSAEKPQYKFGCLCSSNYPANALSHQLDRLATDPELRAAGQNFEHVSFQRLLVMVNFGTFKL